MKKFRAVILLSTSISSAQYGPIRQDHAEAKKDLVDLEKKHHPRTGTIISPGDPLWTES